MQIFNTGGNINTMNKKRRRPLWRRFLLILIIVLFILTLLILFVPPIILSYTINHPVTYAGTTEKHPLQGIFLPEDFNLTANEMMLQTEDGYHIWVSEVDADNPRGVIIYLSGIQQPSVTYFYGHAKWMKEKGFSSVLLEVRGHQNSDGERVCLGFEEILDVQAVVDYIKSQEKYRDTPIVIHGVSMGGAIAINSFGKIKDIDGLIAMSAYSSIEDVVYDLLRRFHVPKLLCRIEKRMIQQRLYHEFGEKSKETIPIEQIKFTNGRPALLIACTGDKDVQPDNMERLLHNAPAQVEYWLRDSWEHFIVKDCDFVNMEQDLEYCQRISDFLDSILEEEN